MTGGIIHIAGLEVRVGPLQRQLCAWCGLRLVDNDLRDTASSDGAEPMAWEVNGLVEVIDGNPTGYIALPHPADGKLPDNACCPPSNRKPNLRVV